MSDDIISEADKKCFEAVATAFCHYKLSVLAKADITSAVELVPGPAEVDAMITEDKILKNFVFAASFLVSQIYARQEKKEPPIMYLKYKDLLAQN